MLTCNEDSTLYGLVLAGGKSTRMGTDKSLLKWHNKEHRYFMADLLKKFCAQVYISCRKDQVSSIPPSYNTITDRHTNLGPLGGIVSAFDFNNKSAWLVVACDLPLLDKETIFHLIRNRSKLAIATAYKNPGDQMPEPLLTIWEPKAYPILQAVLQEGGGPRKVLLNNKIRLVSALNPSALLNANSPYDVAHIQTFINKGTKAVPGVH